MKGYISHDAKFPIFRIFICPFMKVISYELHLSNSKKQRGCLFYMFLLRGIKVQFKLDHD